MRPPRLYCCGCGGKYGEGTQPRRHTAKGLCGVCYAVYRKAQQPPTAPKPVTPIKPKRPKRWRAEDLAYEVEFLTGTRPPRDIAESLGVSGAAIAKALQKIGNDDLATVYLRVYYEANRRRIRATDARRRAARSSPVCAGDKA